MGGVFSNTSGGTGATKQQAGGTISNIDRAVLDLKNTRDRLNKYKIKLEKDEEKLILRAKEAKLLNQTKTAINLLRLRKYKQDEVTQVDSQLLNIYQMVQTISSKQNEKYVLDALKTSKVTLSKMNEETTVDDVLNLMDSLQEQNDVSNEVTELLGNAGISELSIEDESAIEDELNQLMGITTTTTTTTTTTSEELPAVPTSKLPEQLPTVPTTELPTAESTKKEERVAVPS